jgi:hypothetical protein
MLVMAVATSGHLAWSICLTTGIAAQRMLFRPRRTARIIGCLLAVAAACLLVF